MYGAFGRSEFIKELWELLEEKSVYLLGERRVGKTTVIEEMAREAPGGTLAFFFELEATHTPDALAQAIYDRSAEYLPLSRHAGEEVRGLKKLLGGAEAAGVKIPRAEASWQTLLERVMQGLCEQKNYSRVVFFLDEVPMMLQNMPESDRREILNTLRKLDQVYGKREGKIRFVVTGSIGLHHVLSDLREKGYANQPVSDMVRRALPPLSPTDAKILAESWLMGEGLESSSVLTGCIATTTDGLPFYIREIVRALKSEGFSLDEEGVNRAVRYLATDATSAIELDFYNKRIETYYAPNRRALARALLDALARDEALTLAELSSRLPGADPDALESTLKLLEDDLYIRYDEAGRFVFRYGFIRRVWLLLRRLG